MIFFRSALFALLCLLWNLSLFLLCLPLLLLPAPIILAAARFWIGGIFFLLAATTGLRFLERGLRHRPKGPALVAVKHQSTWETFYLALRLADPVFVLKRELLFVPLFGWYLARAGMIAIDRAGGARALKAMRRAAERRLAEGRPIVIFPEGTRVAPGESRPYQPGIAALYSQLAVPVVPVAVNSGLYWPRRSFLKRKGRIVVEYLEPIAPGLDRKAFLKELQTRIETATRRLEAEAREQVDR